MRKCYCECCAIKHLKEVKIKKVVKKLPLTVKQYQDRYQHACTPRIALAFLQTLHFPCPILQIRPTLSFHMFHMPILRKYETL